MIRLTGHKVILIPATLNDRKDIYNWLANSDLTSSMLGPPAFPDNSVPTWDCFVDDYSNNFFNDNNVDDGRSFIILVDGQPVGHINYNEIDRTTSSVELDIWLSNSIHCNKGYGTDAIETLCGYLHLTLHCDRIIIAPSQRNFRAINAYQKAGFTLTTVIPEGFRPDYEDTVVLEKRF